MAVNSQHSRPRLCLEFDNHQKKIPLRLEAIEQLVRIILEQEGVHRGELSIVFVDQVTIRRANKKYLKKDYATDVLAFETIPIGVKPKRDCLFGNIMISIDAAIKQSRAFKTALPEEIMLYVMHAILHLRGYDDHTVKDVKKMRSKEREVMGIISKGIGGITG
jgi:probable rRNA maturation factor